MIQLKANRLKTICIVLAVLLSVSLLAGCSSSPVSTAAPETAAAPEVSATPQMSDAPQKTSVRVLIIPKFEIGGISGDFPGEAQLFYEHYCAGCEETQIDHMPPGARFYINSENGVAILITESGKTAAAMSLMAVLSTEKYDWSETYIVSVGCGGGSAAQTTLGDVILVTMVCDYDLGHHVDAHEKKKSANQIMWFPDNSFADYEFKTLNTDLCEKAFELIKDTPLRTTEEAKNVMLENFPARSEEDVLPAVRKGTALSGDNYWKGIYGHVTANFIAEYYECPDPYMVTEMEEVAVANTAAIFSMLNRLISLRTIVNMDLFLDGQTPESTWGEYNSFSEKVQNENSETLDIFEPAMHNLFDAGSIITDAILSGELK